MAVFSTPIWVFIVRTTDRLGKGLRTGARDAVLSDGAATATKAKIFGFHRSMDTLGAVLGPLFALLYLRRHPQDYKTLFFIAFAPGLVTVICSVMLKDKNVAHQPGLLKVGFFSFLGYWKRSPPAYRKLVSGLLLFTLFNSSDVFLLLKAKQAGMADSQVIIIYIFYNLVYAIFAFPIGIVADKAGLKKIFIAGITIFAMVYGGMAYASLPYHFYILFFFYGLYAAATEGISKAWITNISSRADTATAIGTYSAFQSIFLMLASSLASVIWFVFGLLAIFIISSLMALLVAFFLFLVVPGWNPNAGNNWCLYL